MTELYEYHKRVQNESWLITHIETLLKEAELEQSTTSVLYAAFEARNLIEKICFDLLLMSTSKTEWPEIHETAKGKHGIRRSNDKYKSLRSRFQSFSAVLGRLAGLTLKVFDFKKAGELENDLAEYVHTYTRPQHDMNYASEFIQNGINKIQESLIFIRSYFTIENGCYTYGIVNFSTLPDEFRKEFEIWKIGTSDDTESLYLRLKTLNDKNPLTKQRSKKITKR